MEQYQFKTNINCGGCINAVKPFLEAEPNINIWSVNTDNPDKILTVTVENLSKEKIVEIIEKAGFKAENLD